MKKCPYCDHFWPDDTLKCWDGVIGCGAPLGFNVVDMVVDMEYRGIVFNSLSNSRQLTNFFEARATVIPMRARKIEVQDWNHGVHQLVAREVSDPIKAFIHGTGVEEPLGIINAGATISVTRQISNHICYDDLVSMLRYIPISVYYGLWLMNSSAYAEISVLDSSKNYALSKEKAVSLLGMPLIITNACSEIGNRGDIILADLSYYLIGRYDATEGKTLYDGMPILQWPIKSDDGEHSPFVALCD